MATLATQKFESHLTVIVNQWINSQSLSMHGSNTRLLLLSNDEDVVSVIPKRRTYQACTQNNSHNPRWSVECIRGNLVCCFRMTKKECAKSYIKKNTPRMILGVSKKDKIIFQGIIALGCHMVP